MALGVITVQQLPQIPLSMPAWLYNSEHELQRCRLKAMTLEGLLVETSDDDLEPGAHLTVVFYINIDGMYRRCQETVKVDEVTGHSAGLVFECFDSGHSCNIEKLVHLVASRSH